MLLDTRSENHATTPSSQMRISRSAEAIAWSSHDLTSHKSVSLTFRFPFGNTPSQDRTRTERGPNRTRPECGPNAARFFCTGSQFLTGPHHTEAWACHKYMVTLM